MLVDTRTLLRGESTPLADGAAIEIGYIRLLFRCAPMHTANGGGTALSRPTAPA